MLKESGARWIIGGTNGVLWLTLAWAASAELAMHWYLAIWLAVAMAGCGGIVYLADLTARMRDVRLSAEERAALGESVETILRSIKGQEERLRADVLTADRIAVQRWRGEALAQIDAALEAAARRGGSDTGPLPIVSVGPR